MGRKFGDRKDARRVPISGIMQCCIDLKPGRKDSDVYINQKMDVTELVRFVTEKKAAGAKYTYFHAFLTALAKSIYNRPKLNYFIANRHLYEHNKVSLAFVAKISLDDRSEEVMLLCDIQPDDTIATISERIAEKVETLRKKAHDKKGANSATDFLAKLPNPIRIPIMGIIKWMDAHGILPAGLSADNIYYSSMIVSNLGSIHCGSIYHNITDFGTSSSLTTIGEICPERVIRKDGTEEVRQLCEFGVTLDERIADGFYFAKSAQLIQYILAHPEMLDEPVSTPVTME